MATAAATLGTVLDQLRTNLVARGGLAGVVVVTGEGDETEVRDMIELYAADLESAQISMADSGADTGGLMEADYVVEGRTSAFETGTVSDASGANTTAKAARDAAANLLAEIESELDTDRTIGGTCGMAYVDGFRWQDERRDNGHRAEIEFTIKVKVLHR